MMNPVEYAKGSPVQAILIVAIVIILIMIYRDYYSAKAGLVMRRAGLKGRKSGMETNAKSEWHPTSNGPSIPFQGELSHTGSKGTNAGFLGSMEPAVLYPYGNSADIYAQQQAAARAPEGFKAAKLF